MVLYDVYAGSVQVKYRTTICSKATFIIHFITFISILIPFLVAFRTQGFWFKVDQFREQPDVHFKYEYLVLIETNNIVSPVVCTSINSILQVSNILNSCPIIKVREEDTNKDSRKDILHFEAEATIQGDESVHSVTVLLLFDYKLYSFSWFEMETAGFVQATTPVGAGRVDIMGELRIHQKQPLRNEGRDVRFNTSIIPNSLFNLPSIMKLYTNRNVSTKIDNSHTIWTRGRLEGEPFLITITLLYPEDTILYTPGFWHIIKMAWVQYFACLFPCIFFARIFKRFILDNRIVRTIKEIPWKKSM